MDAFGVLKISGSALEAQRRRMNVIASNMANMQSTRTVEGGPYRRRDVVFSSIAADPREPQALGVRVTDVVTDRRPFLKVYDPGHPDAGADGFVELPNINAMEEMVNMMMSFRSYEASVSAFNIAKSMYQKILELGRT